MPRQAAVHVDNVRLAYSVEGEGVPVLVIGSSVFYPRTFSMSLRRHCRFFFVDLRHFGAHFPDNAEKAISLETYIDDINFLCRALGLQRFTLLGHSHHGNLALEYAKRHPEKIERLALIGSPPADVARTIAASRSMWEAQASAERRRRLDRNYENLKHNVTALSPEEEFVANYVADGPKYWYDPAYDAKPLWRDVPINLHALAAFKHFFVNYTFSLGRPTFNAPVFVAAGKHDYAVPPDLWNETNRGDASFHLFENSGHTPQLEQPGPFDAAFLEWLQRN